MTKQAFEDNIIDLIDDTTGAGVELTDEGTIGVGVTFDEGQVRAEAGRLYDELAEAESVDDNETPEGGEIDDGPTYTVQVTHPTVSPGFVLTPEVYVTSHHRDLKHVIVDIEAWRDSKKISQAWKLIEHQSKNQTLTAKLELEPLPAGEYQLKAFLFEGPTSGSHAWGKKLWANEHVATFTVAPEDQPYASEVPVTAGYARLPQQVDVFVGQYPELKAIADQPTGVWLGMEWVPDAEKRGQEIVTAAGDLPPLIVVYSIPNRDTGEYSQGGAKSPQAYRDWIDALAKGVGDHPAIYILEPDALGHLDRMTPEQQGVRIELLAYAVDALTATIAKKVYIDASMWVEPGEMSRRIRLVDDRSENGLDGFSINTSNYKKLSVCLEYGDKLMGLASLPYLIDTSRNGIGTDLGDGRWCNVPGQGIGERPDLAKGYIWAKAVGESDGPENGGPNAGEFWVEGALALVRNGRLTK